MITYVALHCHCHPLATRFPPPFPPPSGHFSRGPLASENVESRQSVAIELHLLLPDLCAIISCNPCEIGALDMRLQFTLGTLLRHRATRAKMLQKWCASVRTGTRNGTGSH